ncbi:f-box protein skip23 [Nicotiana attenuata]|uniref:F-box protein skip23 n=1 Tax=Nicotiana attenuata TaxID=49451 RepID=A0A1J6KSL7_NICAT|nr:f-box protein skip23 [Nicotiana attenuata]
MGSGTVIPWCNLPKELFERIGKFLETHIDVLRFRAVCTTWRSSLPPFKNSPPLPLEIPFPFIESHPYKSKPGFYLVETRVYLFQPLDGASVDASSCRGWLVKVTQKLDGKLRLLNPRLDPPRPSPSFRDEDMPKAYVKKIVLHTNCVGSKTNSFCLMAITREDHLCYLKSGDEMWTKLKDASFKIVDIIVYKGNFYAVDRYGETIMFDSSFNETKVASKLCDGGRKKRLVESCGQLFLVGMVLDVDKKSEGIGPFPFNPKEDPSSFNPLEIKVYRLDEEQHEWIEVHTLDDRIFFAGDDCCFSVSSRDFGEDYRGNCIYYANGYISLDILREYVDRNKDDDSDDEGGCDCCRLFIRDEYAPFYGGHDNNGSKSGVLSEELIQRYKGLHRHNTGVFTIEDGKLGSLYSCLEYADIFWPPPSWLKRKDQAPSNAPEVAES